MATITQSANKKWRVQIRRRDHPAISRYFVSHKEAQKWARQKETELDRGKRIGAGLTITLADVVRAYRSSLKKTYGHTKKWNLTIIEENLGHYRLDELNSHAVLNFLRKRERDGCGPATNMQTMTYLRTVVRFGGPLVDAGEAGALALARMDILWDSMIHSGEIANSEKRSRRPSQDELQALFDHFDSRPRSNMPMTEICLFAIATAMRLGEIVGPGGIVWEDLDERRRTLWVRARKDPTTPSGRDMEIPLPLGPAVFKGQIIDPLEIMLKQKTARLRAGRVFPYAENTISIAFSNACRQLKIENLRFHDLRHDGISRMFEADWTIAKVAAVSGHKSWKNLQRYTHLRPSGVE